MILKTLHNLKHSNRFPTLRKYLNLLYHDPKMVCVPVDVVTSVNIEDCTFLICDQLNMAQKIEGNYWFKNLLPSDNALDIGSNVGLVAIPLSKRVRRVWTLEPIKEFNDLLEANASLNNITNITMWLGALSNKDENKFEFLGRIQDKVNTCTFQETKGKIGHIHFLKVDIEGYEWDTINPEDCNDIEEVRFEFHIRRSHKKEDFRKMLAWRKWAESSGRWWQMEEAEEPLCVPFSNCYLFAASTRGAL